MKGDLTTGSPARTLLAFTAPMLVGALFQQLYSIVDSVIIGRFVSLDALAAVSVSYPVTTLFVGMATGGSGDVLAGILVGLLGQGIPPLEAAACGAWLHGAAGYLAARELGQYGMLPTDMLRCLPRLLK